MNTYRILPFVGLMILSLAACGGGSTTAGSNEEEVGAAQGETEEVGSEDSEESVSGQTEDAPDESAGQPSSPAGATGSGNAGSCLYREELNNKVVSSFCVHNTGTAYMASNVKSACEESFSGDISDLYIDGPCPTADSIGSCTQAQLGNLPNTGITTVYYSGYLEVYPLTSLQATGEACVAGGGNFDE